MNNCILDDCFFCNNLGLVSQSRCYYTTLFHNCETTVYGCGRLNIIISNFAKKKITETIHCFFRPDKFSILNNKITFYKQEPPIECVYKWNIIYNTRQQKFRLTFTRIYGGQTQVVFNRILDL